MSVIKVNKENFENEVLKCNKKVLLDFYADWCGPCQMFARIVDDFAKDYPEYKIAKINVDEEPDLASQFKVMSIPSVFVIENGKVISHTTGAKNRAQLLKMLR